MGAVARTPRPIPPPKDPLPAIIAPMARGERPRRVRGGVAACFSVLYNHRCRPSRHLAHVAHLACELVLLGACSIHQRGGVARARARHPCGGVRGSSWRGYHLSVRSACLYGASRAPKEQRTRPASIEAGGYAGSAPPALNLQSHSHHRLVMVGRRDTPGVNGAFPPPALSMAQTAKHHRHSGGSAEANMQRPTDPPTAPAVLPMPHPVTAAARPSTEFQYSGDSDAACYPSKPPRDHGAEHMETNGARLAFA
jgi:hypothetical protein